MAPALSEFRATNLCVVPQISAQSRSVFMQFIMSFTMSSSRHAFAQFSHAAMQMASFWSKSFEFVISILIGVLNLQPYWFQTTVGFIAIFFTDALELQFAEAHIFKKCFILKFFCL